MKPREVNPQPFEEMISAVVLAVSLQLSVVSFWMNEANPGAPGLCFCLPAVQAADFACPSASFWLITYS
jgi:hypothetical protein